METHIHGHLPEWVGGSWTVLRGDGPLAATLDSGEPLRPGVEVVRCNGTLPLELANNVIRFAPPCGDNTL